MQAVPPPTMKRAGRLMIPAIVPPFRIIPMMMKTQAPTRPMRGDMRADSRRARRSRAAGRWPPLATSRR